MDTVTIVDDLGNPVSGASVSVDLFRDGSLVGSGNGTTVTFSLKNAALGEYTTTITDVTASGLTWDGITPPNTFSKVAAVTAGLGVPLIDPATIQATINDDPEDRTELRTARETLLAALAGEQDRIPSSHHFSARTVDLVLSGYKAPTEDGLTTELALHLESGLLDQIFEDLATGR